MKWYYQTTGLFTNAYPADIGVIRQVKKGKTMQRKIKLNKTYITKMGTEFTPIKKIEGKVKQGIYYGCTRQPRLESRYENEQGDRIKKSNLLKIKD